jgi:hypothetical protein
VVTIGYDLSRDPGLLASGEIVPPGPPAGQPERRRGPPRRSAARPPGRPATIRNKVHPAATPRTAPADMWASRASPGRQAAESQPRPELPRRRDGAARSFGSGLDRLSGVREWTLLGSQAQGWGREWVQATATARTIRPCLGRSLPGWIRYTIESPTVMRAWMRAIACPQRHACTSRGPPDAATSQGSRRTAQAPTRRQVPGCRRRHD